ncbi:TrkA family potassium uptake protein [Leifsonia sp. H3M29-4]|uniref:potassium channel family protein n=1 Tax=Salinibacterium metalliresistens TaxID=3031321 RepID=UPI0023DA3124|nr:TrkA family potassium uptake protein [Salinibacterium metalliresistens]MDF1477864.1 TrkA family potassium uptake protein [Salinibacterium metalliresistens]
MAKLHIFSKGETERVAQADSVAVIGLGRFGSSLALELMANGTEVLGIDENEESVQELNGRLTHVVQADSTKEEVLRQLSVPEFDRVVVAIGSDVQASILTTSLLLRFGIKHLWAKAVSQAHGTILEQLGVQHVIYPESDMGRRVAHLVRGSMQDYLDIGDDFSLVKMAPPAHMVGKSLGQSEARSRFGVTIVAIKPAGGRWDYTSADTIVSATDTILVAGATEKAESFSQFR